MGTPSTFLAAVASFADYANVLHRILRNKNRRCQEQSPWHLTRPQLQFPRLSDCLQHSWMMSQHQALSHNSS